MKRLVFILFTIGAVITIKAQDATKFEYQQKGLNDYVVTNVEVKTADEIYASSLNWVKETYKNPDEVIKATIEGKKIRLSGVASNLLIVKKKYPFPLKYTAEIAVKDGRYKFEIFSIETPPNEYGNGADYKNIEGFKTKKSMVKNFGESPDRIENYFNNLNKSLKNYIESGNLSENDEDW
ncbi:MULTISPECIES: DUF4468 domain-containing protein [Flavobacteriaceae]|uniref:DUF4468 domain-containing protein n=1 Tax=Flavobacteriaceae TaxID=49546 RepID=UPI0014919E97|nr:MULTISPECIES: DUF4468 domain-containing protein [Allomuricauda]MDC6364830.1 DUF4468 domain-containing protein [Muricauda sp. AC10]